jgi:hypothetical protein
LYLNIVGLSGTEIKDLVGLDQSTFLHGTD